jgi:hypothetical protein
MGRRPTAKGRRRESSLFRLEDVPGQDVVEHVLPLETRLDFGKSLKNGFIDGFSSGRRQRAYAIWLLLRANVRGRTESSLFRLEDVPGQDVVEHVLPLETRLDFGGLFFERLHRRFLERAKAARLRDLALVASQRARSDR